MNFTSPPKEAAVFINLSVISPDDVTFPERRLVLTESRPAVEIGRSSNRPTLHIQSATTNGWFDSPVMSRHHAVIKADIPNKAVTIHDSSSMHGTYLNNAKLSSEKRLRYGDKLIFGLPVYRNERTFQPATVRVEKLEFQEGPRPTTSPNRVFTVPDDCSTDDNEPMDESMDDPLPCPSNPKENPGHLEPFADRPRSVPQLDGIIDLISELDDAETTHGFRSDLDDEAVRLSDDDDMNSLGESSLDSLDLSSTPHNANHGAGSPSPSWNSIASDSASEETDEDLEHYSSLSEDEEEGLFVYETDSDDMERLSEHPEESREPSSLLQSCSQAPDSGAPRLPPLNSVLPPGQWGSGARCEPFTNVPMATVHEGEMLYTLHRLPSPSDAVLPHGSRLMGAGNKFVINDLQEPSHVIGNDCASASDGRVSATTMGQKSGKPDYFEAREQNKLTIARITEQGLSFRPSPEIAFGSNNKSFRVAPPLEKLNLPRPSISSCKTTFNDKPADNEGCQSEISPPRFSHRNHVNDDSVFLPTSVEDECGSASAENRRNAAASWVDYDPYDFEPASAYELQQLKQRRNEQASDAVSIVPKQDVDVTLSNPENLHHTDENTTDEYLGMSRGDETSVQTDNKGKRKAAEISEVSEAEIDWARDIMMEAIKEDAVIEEPVTPSGAASPHTPPPPCPTLVQSPLLSPPTTPEETANPQARPTKRMKKIAERMGYAALGGATVGAMVLTSLIYTAPTFV